MKSSLGNQKWPSKTLLHPRFFVKAHLVLKLVYMCSQLHHKHQQKGVWTNSFELVSDGSGCWCWHLLYRTPGMIPIFYFPAVAIRSREALLCRLRFHICQKGDWEHFKVGQLLKPLFWLLRAGIGCFSEVLADCRTAYWYSLYQSFWGQCCPTEEKATSSSSLSPHEGVSAYS